MNGVSKVLNISIIDISFVKQVVSSANGTEIVVTDQSAWTEIPIGHDPVTARIDATNQDAGILYTCSFEAKVPARNDNREVMNKIAKIRNGLAKLKCASGEVYLFGTKEFPLNITTLIAIGNYPGAFNGYIVSASATETRQPQLVSVLL